MSADFLTDSQVQNYGRYAAEPNEVQLARYFHLDERDRDFVNQRRGRHNRLGIALQITTVRFLGTFINDAMQIPAGVRHYVATQLGIPRPEILSRYARRENTRWEHHALIRQHYEYHDFGDQPWSFRLKRLLYVRAWLSNERPGLLFDFATAWLLQHDVVIVQLAGKKKWKFENEDVTLKAGDILFVRKGTLHNPVTEDGHQSLHLTVGLVNGVSSFPDFPEPASEEDHAGDVSAVEFFRSMGNLLVGTELVLHTGQDILPDEDDSYIRFTYKEKVLELTKEVFHHIFERRSLTSFSARPGADRKDVINLILSIKQASPWK